MQTIVALFAFVVAVASAGLVSPVAYAPATYLTRAPAFDSAVIKSDRLGGNFAYSVAESHAYAAHTPIVQHVTSPVAVSYSAPQHSYAPAAYGYAGYPYGAYNGAYNGIYNGAFGYNGALGYTTLLKK